MLCKRPFMAGRIPFGCGQCMPCRIKRRRQHMWRQYLESLCHDENCFVTLTYSDENLPAGGNLVPLDLSLFLKRLRKALYPIKVRFYGVGEYGSDTFRPHYHLSLYGVSGRTDVISSRTVVHHGTAGLIQKAWPLGRTFTAEFNELTAQYVAGYVVKKMTHAGHPALKGRHPEFARMSRMPGLGANAMRLVAETLMKENRLNKLFGEIGDVPHELRLGRRVIRLDRYMLQKLREACGLTEEHISAIKEVNSYERSQEMYRMLVAALDVSPLVTPKKIYEASVVQPIRNAEGRAALYKKKDTL